MDEFEEFNNVSISQEELEMKRKGRKRLFTALLISCIFLGGYIIYSLIMLFMNLH